MQNNVTTTAYTAGPWYANLVDLVIYTGDHTKIAVIHQQVEPTEDSDVTSANARLIAAAPELLGALRAVANDCEKWLDDWPGLSADDLAIAIKNAAIHAIACAEGED